MARQSLGAASVAAFVETFGGRLRALAAAHDLLVSAGWGGTALGELIRRSLTPHGFPGRIVVEVEADGLLLPALAQDLALTLHELGTNAIKHGALRVPAGRVLVRAQVEPGRDGAELRLVWREEGGPRGPAPQGVPASAPRS